MNLRKLIEDANLNSYKPTPVKVPEWGGIEVYVKIMDGKQRERLEYAILNKLPYRHILMIGTICDADGKCLFSEADTDEVTSLNGNAVDRICTVAYQLNTVGKEDTTKLGEALPTNT